MSIYYITVKPGSSQEKITKTDDNSFTIYLRAKAHDGEANEALLKLLSKHFKVAKTTIRIIRGSHSRMKVVEF